MANTFEVIPSDRRGNFLFQKSSASVHVTALRLSMLSLPRWFAKLTPWENSSIWLKKCKTSRNGDPNLGCGSWFTHRRLRSLLPISLIYDRIATFPR